MVWTRQIAVQMVKNDCIHSGSSLEVEVMIAFADGVKREMREWEESRMTF